MSALRATRVVETPVQAERERRPKLALLTGGKHQDRFAVIRAPLRARSAVPFAVICIGMLVSSLVAVLVITTWMANGSYEMARLQRAATRAAQDVQILHEQVRAAQAELPAQAAELGMVPAQQPIALDVSSAIVFTSQQMVGQHFKPSTALTSRIDDQVDPADADAVAEQTDEPGDAAVEEAAVVEGNNSEVGE